MQEYRGSFADVLMSLLGKVPRQAYFKLQYIYCHKYILISFDKNQSKVV
jgi:hypothetical protein